MNPLQMALQIKHLLEQATWPGGSQDLIFGTSGTVAVFAGPPSAEQIPLAGPWALIGFDVGEIDDDAPDLIAQQFSISIGAEVAGDALGEFALIGGAAPDVGSSAGRGVAELVEQVCRAVGDLTGDDGALAILSSVSTGTPAILGDGRHIALADVTLRATCTVAAHYAAPQEFRQDGATLRWEGAHCSDRYDFQGYSVEYVEGSSPQAALGEGTEIYSGTNNFAAHVMVPGRSYTVFAIYADRPASPASASGVERGAYRVV